MHLHFDKKVLCLLSLAHSETWNSLQAYLHTTPVSVWCQSVSGTNTITINIIRYKDKSSPSTVIFLHAWPRSSSWWSRKTWASSIPLFTFLWYSISQTQKGFTPHYFRCSCWFWIYLLYQNIASVFKMFLWKRLL